MMKSRSHLAVRVWSRSQEHDVFGQAAQLSYYFLLAVFPFLLFLTTVFGLMAHTGSEVYENLLAYGRQMLPYNVFEMVNKTLKEIQSGAGGGKLSFGLVLTLWTASSGMSALMDGLNRASGVKDSRPWWKARALAVVFTLLFSAFLVAATVLVLYGTRLGDLIAGYFGFETYFTAVWQLLQWPVALMFLLVAMALLYRFAPDRTIPWRRVLPGALAGTVLWLAVSLGLRLYLQFFNSYNRTYGSLGAVIVLLLWFYLSGAAILMGSEVNAELEKAG